MVNQLIKYSGRVFERGSPEFDKLLESSNEPDELDFPTPEILPGARAIIWIDITRVGTACGFSVPFMKFESHRKHIFYVRRPGFTHQKPASATVGDQLNQIAARMEARDNSTEDPYALHWEKGLLSYWVKINSWSIDGLPGMKQVMPRISKEGIIEAMEEHGVHLPKGLSPGKLHELSTMLIGVFIGILLMSVLQRGTRVASAPSICVGDACVHV